MKVTDLTREALAVRRERRALESLGYKRHETDWEIHRGYLVGGVIKDAKISVDGKYVYTLVGERPDLVKLDT